MPARGQLYVGTSGFAYPYWSPWVVSPAIVGGRFGRFHSFRFGHHGKRGGFMHPGRGPRR